MDVTPYWTSSDGRLVIYHGRAEDVSPMVTPAGVALVLADPPYGVDYRSGRASRKVEHQKPGMHGGRLKSSSWLPIEGDTHQFDPSPWLAYDKVILWGANHFADRLPSSKSWLVWDKRASTGSDDGADCELAWTNLDRPVRRFVHLWRGVCRASETGQAPLHPTQKPIALMVWCIERAGLQPDAIVLDPYMGSGPVAVACARLGYRYIGIEIEERYAEIAAKRLEDPPMLAAVKAEQGDLFEAVS